MVITFVCMDAKKQATVELESQRELSILLKYPFRSSQSGLVAIYIVAPETRSRHSD
jgi:hypothetical protein